ncbi:hypothetical protein F5Y11DRAFT_363614 [Daldinia sp. FL1419]|nr:hypothetical protein F5Y11DRAFT_363614 [Daldinia sp. FL1419]
MDAAISNFGQIDILLNNVGIMGARGTTTELDLDRWRQGLDVNVTSMANVVKLAVLEMLKNGESAEEIRGSIINMGSVTGLEHYFASDPIMPLSTPKAPSFTPLIFVVLLNFMANGCLLWYTVLWLQEVRHWTPMQFAMGWTPFRIGGAAATFLATYLIPRVSAQWILAMGAFCVLAANLPVATMPEQQSYWYKKFPKHCSELVISRLDLHSSTNHCQQFG